MCRGDRIHSRFVYLSGRRLPKTKQEKTESRRIPRLSVFMYSCEDRRPLLYCRYGRSRFFFLPVDAVDLFLNQCAKGLIIQFQTLFGSGRFICESIEDFLFFMEHVCDLFVDAVFAQKTENENIPYGTPGKWPGFQWTASAEARR